MRHLLLRLAVLSVVLSLSISLQAGILDRPFLKASSLVVVIGGSDFKENGGVGPVAVDFLLLDQAPSGQAAPDLIGADGVTTKYFSPTPYNPISDGTERENELLRIENQLSGGVLTNVADFNVLNSNDSLTEFGLGSATDIDMTTFYRFSRFFVASNAPFDIYAQASNLSKTGDFTSASYSTIRYILFTQTAFGGVNGWGTRAQNPATGGLGRITSINDLGDMSAGPTKVFDGGRRTARIPGTLLEQAVAFVPIYYIYQGDPGNAYDLSLGTGTISADVTYTVYTP